MILILLTLEFFSDLPKLLYILYKFYLKTKTSALKSKCENNWRSLLKEHEKEKRKKLTHGYWIFPNCLSKYIDEAKINFSQ